MVFRNIRPCSICAGVSATSTVKRWGPVALTIVSADDSKRWSWALAENVNKLPAIAPASSNSARRVIMRRFQSFPIGDESIEHTPKGVEMTGKSLHPEQARPDNPDRP